MYGIDHFLDIVETFYQLQQEGQLIDSNGLFATLLGELAGSKVSNTFYKIAIEFVIEQTIGQLWKHVENFENLNVDELVKGYKESIDKGHRVVLVSHSQGNLFGLRSFDRLEPWQKDYFRQVSVATPASRVAHYDGYVTLNGDLIIKGVTLLGALPGNAVNPEQTDLLDMEHEFINAYLMGSVTSIKIIDLIKTAIDNSHKAPSQWQFEDEKPACSIEGCFEKLRGVKHKYDNSLDFYMIGRLVYPFS